MRASDLAGRPTRPAAKRARSRRALGLVVSASLAAATIATVSTPVPAGASVARAAANAGRLTIQAPGVSVLKKGTTTFTKAKNNQKVKTGDTVQTDGTGLAEILFPDGSVTRLDVSTVFNIEALATTTGTRQIEASVSTGQTWNRVQKLSESEGSTFQQKGGGATAAVLGTGFLTACSPTPGATPFVTLRKRKALRTLAATVQTCTFLLVEGQLEVATPEEIVQIEPGEQVAVVAGDVGEPEVVPPDVLLSIPWVAQNIAADVTSGIVQPKGPATPADLKQARIEGSWPVTLTVADPGGFRNLTGSLSRTYTFSSDCTSGECLVTLSAETANGTRVIPLSYADGVYTGQDPDLGTQDCVLDDGSVSVPNGLRNSSTVTFSVTAAVDDAGLWRATGLSGKVTETATQVDGDPALCLAGTATFDLAASR